MRYIYAVCEASFHQHQFTVYIVCSRNCMHRRRTRISEYTAIKPGVYVTANGDTVSSSSYSIKKRSERHKHCALAVVRRSQKFSPCRRPPSRGAGRPKFNQLEMVTTFTYKPSLVTIDARNFELSW